MGVRRALCVRGWQRDHEQAVACVLCRFSQSLGEGELGLESTGRQVTLIVKLPRVGHPLIDQNQGRTVLLEQLAQRIAWIGGPLVVRPNARERLLAT